jgi:hypothetical protein
MKKIVSIVSVFALATTLFAASIGYSQSFTVAAMSAQNSGDVNGYIPVDIEVTNVTGNVLNLRVQITDKSGLPADWLTQICFFENCFPPATESIDGEFPANGSEMLDISFLTGATPATGCVEVTLTNLDNTSEAVTMTFCATTSTSSIGGGLPTARTLSLSQNFPNPFSASKSTNSTIAFFMPTAGNVTLTVYNLLGKEIRTLINETRNVGKSSVAWDGRNNSGRQVPAGIYIYKLSTNAQSISKRLMYTR